MKKIVAIFIAVLLVVCIALCLEVEGKSNSQFLRIHIRANSNNSIDQNVKYAVKTAVVDYLTPFVAEAYDKETALEIVSNKLLEICQVADRVLAENGIHYKSRAEVCVEQFPTRSYSGVTLDSGFYDALMLYLGDGVGDNWWCVVYPPLCFVGGESNGTNSITYKSKIAEIIEKWRDGH